MKPHSQRKLCFAFLIGLFVCGGCGATRPVDSGAPTNRGSADYPVRFLRADEGRDRAIAAWRRIAQIQNGDETSDPSLHPVTSTIVSLPAAAPPLLKLPRVGDPNNLSMNDNETREALRRFLANSSDLLGAEIIQLSLREVAGGEEGLKVARYQQRPFLYPLRNNYGVVEIGFAPNGQITRLSSSCIPAEEQLRRAVDRLTPRLGASEIAVKLANRTVTLTDETTRAERAVTITAAEEIRARELVIYPLMRPGELDALELHLAWDVSIKVEGREHILYVDALTGEILNSPAAGELSFAREILIGHHLTCCAFRRHPKSLRS